MVVVVVVVVVGIPGFVDSQPSRRRRLDRGFPFRSTIAIGGDAVPPMDIAVVVVVVVGSLLL